MVRLSADDQQSFVRDGFVVVRDAVPERFLVKADTEIDALIAEVPPMEGDGGPGQSSWFMPRARLPECENALRRSGALDIADELVAPHGLDFAFDHVQVATTVPPWSHVPGGPHIDGHGPGQDPPASFTMLAGIMLTDQQDAASGNLWVWPGSHFDHRQLFRDRGTRVLCSTFGHSTSLDPPMGLGPAMPITGRRGDLVLAHFLLGHNKGGNTASHDRRTIYFRLAVPGHADRWEQTFINPWTEYPALNTSDRPVT
ncbi:MAG: phytanoyl-CoA dioxygenase family protein [Acidimicrobiales bacterium]|nr:phytanoyl-CoA dioxygenase family protein [Acidimicrobiales bacterium]